MIEKTVLNYLSDNLPVPVFMEVPEEDIPEKYVVLEKTGAGISDHIRYDTIAAQSYAQRLSEAAALSGEVVAAFEQMAADNAVASAKFQGEYNFTDPETKRYRYQAVHDIYYI